MTDRAGFEQFLEEYTGRGIEWHKQGGTWGIDEQSFVYAIWKKLAESSDDAKRYQWLKSREALSLTYCKRIYGMWTREKGEKFFAPYSLAEGGTQHGAHPSLDELIDAAMVIAEERDNVRSKNKP